MNTYVQHLIENKITPEIWCNKKLGWISIPKNANMATRKMMNSLRATRQKYVSQNPDTLFCVWRDPQDRLISALGEFKRRKRDTRTIEELMVVFESGPSGFDEHLVPQCYYIEHMLHRKFDFVFRFEHLREDMLASNLFDAQLVKSNIKPSTSSRLKDFNELRTTNSLLIDQIIEKYYAEDLKIYNDLSIIKK